MSWNNMQMRDLQRQLCYLSYFDHHSRCFNVLGSTKPTLVFVRVSACFGCQFGGPMSNSFPGSSLFGKRTAEAKNISHEDIVHQRGTEARYVCQYQAECDATTGVSQTVLSRRNSQARCHPWLCHCESQWVAVCLSMLYMYYVNVPWIDSLLVNHIFTCYIISCSPFTFHVPRSASLRRFIFRTEASTKREWHTSDWWWK